MQGIGACHEAAGPLRLTLSPALLLPDTCACPCAHVRRQGRSSGVNFALPSDMLLRVVPNLILYGNAMGKGV